MSWFWVQVHYQDRKWEPISPMLDTGLNLAFKSKCVNMMLEG